MVCTRLHIAREYLASVGSGDEAPLESCPERRCRRRSAAEAAQSRPPRAVRPAERILAQRQLRTVFLPTAMENDNSSMKETIRKSLVYGDHAVSSDCDFGQFFSREVGGD